MTIIQSFVMRVLPAACICSIAVPSSIAQIKSLANEGDKSARTSSAGTPRYALLNINNLTTWLRHDGHSNHSPGADNGTYYPRGTGNVIYQDCLLWGGKVFKDAAYAEPFSNTPLNQNIRVGGGTYGIGTRGGNVNGFGASAVAADPNASHVRIYRIRRDYYTMSYFDLQRDAASVNEISTFDVTQNQMDAVRAQYALDWVEWPVSLGAPFIDRNGNGVYDPPPPFNTDPNAGAIFTVDSLIAQGWDEPGVSGEDDELPADQVIWTVYNDLNEYDAQSFAGSLPIGLEVQKTIWGYDRDDALGNFYLVRYKLINRGGIDTSDSPGTQLGSFWIDSMFVGQWSDPDLGSFSDDLVGCDTLKGLGFVYNYSAVDATFRSFNLPPPSAGYDFLAGPTVPSIGDSALVDFRRVHGAKNLGSSSFPYFSPGPPTDSPLPGDYYHFTGRYWKLLRGFTYSGDITTPDIPFVAPPGITSVKHPFSGDPLAQTGWLDGQGTPYSPAPGDRRFSLNTGPFRFAPGDTQEVYVGFVVGLGADRLSSVAAMKLNDAYVQSVFNNLLRVPKPPAEPIVSAAELDREIILQWGVNDERVRKTEETIVAGTFAFEGYNIYQLPSANSDLSEGVRLTTLDVMNGVENIIEAAVDQVSGYVTYRLKFDGADTGIRRSLQITRDRLIDPDNEYSRDPLVNGKEYHFAVTAYNRNIVPDGIPVGLESEPVVITVKPRRPFGVEQSLSYGDTLSMERRAGSGDGTIVALITDPLAGTGRTYRITFGPSASGTWSLYDKDANATVQSDRPLTGPRNFFTAPGGVDLMVSQLEACGLLPGGWTWNPAGTRFLTWVNGDALDLEGFNGAAGWTSPLTMFIDTTRRPVPAENIVSVRIVFSETSSVDAGAFNQANDDTASYAYRFLRNANAPAAQPSFATWIINAATGYAFQDYRISVPLAAYDVDQNPPQRLAVGFLENNVADGSVDGYYWPPLLTAGRTNVDEQGPREWLFIMKSSYTGSTSDGTWQDVVNDSTIPVMYTMTWTRRTNNPWPAGNSIDLSAQRVLSPADTFEYFVPAPVANKAIERASVARIGVFPNPYYAHNAWATSSFRPFVTFNNLPTRAVIRIYNLAGHLVRSLHKETQSQFFEWDLRNGEGWLVASGMYLCHIELPDLNMQKVLKLAVIQENPVPE